MVQCTFLKGNINFIFCHRISCPNQKDQSSAVIRIVVLSMSPFAVVSFLGPLEQMSRMCHLNVAVSLIFRSLYCTAATSNQIKLTKLEIQKRHCYWSKNSLSSFFRLSLVPARLLTRSPVLFCSQVRFILPEFRDKLNIFGASSGTRHWSHGDSWVFDGNSAWCLHQRKYERIGLLWP